MNIIEETVRNHGQKRNIQELKDYVTTLSLEQLTELTIKRIHSPEYISFLNYLMEAFTDTTESHENRYQLVVTILKQTEKQTIPKIQVDMLINCIRLEFTKFKSLYLVELCDSCMESIQTGKLDQLSWKEIFPVLIEVIHERENVEFNSEEMSGIEYKKQIVIALLMMTWSTNIITTLADMFNVFPLSKDEHLHIVKKLCQYFEKLTPQEMPSFVYNLLQLCKYQNGRMIFLRLQEYFGDKIYNNSITDRNTENMELIADSAFSESVQAESTIFFHIYQSASNEQDSVKNYLTSLSNITKSPETVLHPFHLTVILLISTISPIYEEKVFTIIKSAISRVLNEDNKKSHSIWFREMVPTCINLEKLFKQIINCCVDERDLVMQGLVNFSVTLLGVCAMIGRETIAEKQWSLGQFIIMKLIKVKRRWAPNIIQTLSNFIMTNQSVTQYLDCLNMITRQYAFVMLENQNYLVDLMEQLTQVPGNVANEILEAVIPLTKISPTIRNHLILLLRKALYSRLTETRQMAVTGFLILLKNLKISNLAAISQSSNTSSSFSSGRSVMSQISMSQTSGGGGNSCAFSNEALCLEVLGILRRCFMQQAEVKLKLYDGLYDAVCMNPDLGTPILDLMWFHFSSFYETSDEIIPPINFKKITQHKDADVILMEPIGKFIYAIGLIFTKVAETSEDNAILRRYTKVFESLSNRMIQCELEHFDLDDGTDLQDVMPESQEKVFILKEAISVYEALIGYKISSWSPHSKKYAESINSLFQGYTRLIQFSKNIGKTKKGDKKKVDANKSTQNDTTQNITQKSGDKKLIFKINDTILDFQAVGKLLNLLHKNIKWTSTEQANLIKRKHDIHKYIIQVTITLINNLKSQKTIEQHNNKMYYSYCTSIAATLYACCITRFKEFSDFDANAAILALECFYSFLQLINQHYKHKWITFLATVGACEKHEEMVVLLTEFINVFQKLFEDNEEIDKHDAETNKTSLIIINTLAILIGLIPIESNALSAQVLQWTKEYASTKKIESKLVVVSFINIMFQLQIKYKSTTIVFKNISTKLCEVYGTVSDDEIDAIEDIAILNENTVSVIMQSLCASIKSILDDFDWIILRLKAEYNILVYNCGDFYERRRELLKTKERGLCCQICEILKIFDILNNVSIPAGILIEIMIKNDCHIFNLLGNLGKYFHTRSSNINVAFQAARYESVVKLAGKRLFPTVYKFILHIEQNQTTPETETKKKANAANFHKSKVLRETRMIPKLVFEIEQFSKIVIQLSARTKVDLSKYVGQGTARDFRIMDLKGVLEKDDNAASTQNTTQASTVQQDERDDESVMDASDGASTQAIPDCDDESEAPPSKKSKKAK